MKTQSAAKPSKANHASPEEIQSGTEVEVSPPQVCEEIMQGGFKPMEMCPMAEMCKGMMSKEGTGGGWLLYLPGVILVLGGLLVILVPNLLVWLVGVAAIVLGLVVCFLANGIRKLGRRT